MPYGTIKVDTVTFTTDGVDKSVSISGLVQNPTFSGNVTVTGTISGVTVTGTTASFTSGNFTNISGGTHTITSGVFAAGSATNPSISFTSDPNTGIYSPGADQVAISTNGTGRLFVDSSGRVGVGTTSPSSIATGYGVIHVSGSNGGGVVLGSSGYVAGSSSGVELGTTTSNPVTFFSNNTERMRIGANGAVAIGTTNTATGYTLNIDSANGLRVGGWGAGIGVGAEWNTTVSTTSTAISFTYSTTEVGKITTTSTATAYVTSSDYRLKENVTAVTDGITRLQQLKPSRFNFIADPTKTVDGFIAHEVQNIVPEAITGEKDEIDDKGNPVYQGIDQSKLVPLLTAALQEAVAKIESLEARLTAAGI